MPNIRWLPAVALVAPALSGLPAHAAQYATAQEAVKRSFPDSTGFKDTSVSLTADELRALGAAAGVPGRSVQWRVLLVSAGDKPLGVVVIDAVVGKFELIDYAVAMGTDGKVRNVEILTYRESHGYEVRLAPWRKQFVGKDKSAKLRLSDDIANISGATLSCEHVTDGVRRIVALVALLHASGKV